MIAGVTEAFLPPHTYEPGYFDDAPDILRTGVKDTFVRLAGPEIARAVIEIDLNDGSDSYARLDLNHRSVTVYTGRSDDAGHDAHQYMIDGSTLPERVVRHDHRTLPEEADPLPVQPHHVSTLFKHLAALPFEDTTLQAIQPHQSAKHRRSERVVQVGYEEVASLLGTLATATIRT